MQYDLGVISPPLERVEQIQTLYDAAREIHLSVWQNDLTQAEQKSVEEYRSLQEKYDRLVANSAIFPADAFKANKVRNKMSDLNQEVEYILAKSAARTHQLTKPLLVEIYDLEKDLTLSVGGSQMELIRHLLAEFKMLGPETRETGLTLPTNFPGWPNPVEFGFSDDKEFEQVATSDQALADQRLVAYQAAEEELLRWHEQEQGISPHKLATSAGWIITPIELTKALDQWNKNQDAPRLKELIIQGPANYYFRKPGTDDLQEVGQAWDITEDEVIAWLAVWDRLLALFTTAAACNGLQVS